jgi:hypothetical protein
MSNDSELCCEWKNQAWDDHDRILQCLIREDQDSYIFLRNNVKLQSQVAVLPINHIAVIDYGQFAEDHKDIITFESLATAHAISAMAKREVSCIKGTGTITMSAQ